MTHDRLAYAWMMAGFMWAAQFTWALALGRSGLAILGLVMMPACFATTFVHAREA